tara:strand:- start:628 stop:750 length:123 start_codon:yes stop_codon:yes gene_type:complete
MIQKKERLNNKKNININSKLLFYGIGIADLDQNLIERVCK